MTQPSQFAVSPACPDDLTVLDWIVDSFQCPRCARRFIVLNGIPQLLPQVSMDNNSIESTQLLGYENSLSQRPEKFWHQPVRLFLNVLGNGYLYSWAAR